MEQTAVKRFFGGFIKTERQKEKTTEIDERSDLMLRLSEAKTRLDALENEYNCLTDFNEIEVYISEIEAAKKHYSYLFGEAKRRLNIA